MTISSTATGKTSRVRLQFSLRRAFIFVTLAGCVFAWELRTNRMADERSSALRLLESLGAEIEFRKENRIALLLRSLPLFWRRDRDDMRSVVAINLGEDIMAGIRRHVYADTKGRPISISSAHPSRSPGDVRRLRAFPELERLSFAQAIIDDGSLSGLTPLLHLEVLELTGTGVTDTGIEYLLQLPSLSVLDLRATAVTDQGIGLLRRLSSLRTLRLGPTQSSVDPGRWTRDLNGLGIIKSGPQSSVDREQRTPYITDKGIGELAGLNLEELDLRGTMVGDAAIPLLAEMVSLKILNLSATDITNRSLDVLQDMERLTCVIVAEDFDFTRVTRWRVNRLRNERPDLLVVYEKADIEIRVPMIEGYDAM